MLIGLLSIKQKSVEFLMEIFDMGGFSFAINDNSEISNFY